MTIFKELFAGRKLVLASNSPRRRDLLAMLGLQFVVDPADVDEDFAPELTPREIALTVARRKALTTARRHPHAIVVAADTIVVLDEQILGKPKDADEATKMLRILSGRTHEVYTGFCIVLTPENTTASEVEQTKVTFHPMSDAEIASYVASGCPMDKAGAYGIQDMSAVFVARIDGCFYNVVGFPLARFYQSCRVLLSTRKKL